MEECQICFADGSVSSYLGANDKEFEVEEFDTSGEDKETLDAIQDIVCANARNIPRSFDEGWLCICGRYNTNDCSSCSNCGISKVEAFKITDSTFVAETIDKHHQNENERNERAKQEEIEKKKARKSRNIKICIGVIVGIVLAILIGRAIVMSGRTTYSSVDEMKTSLQGTYTYYDKNGTAMRQAVISGDKLKLIWKYSGASDLDNDIDWNPKSGTFRTFEEWVVLSDGSIKNDGEVYKKGGYMSTSTSTSNSYESGASVLKITIDSVTSNSSYTICTGSVKNNGTKTYKYVEVKGSFKDSSGNVVDTDWTYAAGSEGLSPGESTTFRLSVTKNSKINSCSVSLLDYD